MRFHLPFRLAGARGLAAYTSFILAIPSGVAAPLQDSASPLRIVVLEGDSAINNVRLHRAKEPVIRVENSDGKAVAGASVTFVTPVNGPGGMFLDGQNTLSVTTDDKGLATGRGLRPNHSIGEYQIRTTASFEGETATARITQINAEPTVANNSSRKILIVTLIGGLAAGGAVAAASMGKGNKTPASTPTATTITAGAPGFGPPQ